MPGSHSPVAPGRGAARGAHSNPANRFERISVEPDPDFVAEAGVDAGEPDIHGAASRRTEFFKDHASSIISRNDSPDVGFETSVNPYRGCEHGCAYCYARPYHEYLGFSAGLDFESRIMVKEDAPELLREALLRPGWKPQPLAMSGVTDCYQPVERRLRLTRRCLEILVEFRQPVTIITKNALVSRDADLLAELARYDAARVTLSITTLDAELARAMEPRASPPAQRLEAIRALREAGVPAGVNIAPVIPGLNDHEIPRILESVAAVGGAFAGIGMLRLPFGVKDLFVEWLDQHFPGKAARVLARIREVRGGRLNDSTWGTRLTGQGIFAEQIRALFHASARRLGLGEAWTPLSTAAFRRPGPQQLELGGL